MASPPRPEQQGGEAFGVDVAQVSRQLSWVLRRGARQSGVRIDKEGWVQVADLLECKYFDSLAEEKILHVIAASNKQKERYELRRSSWGAGKDVRAIWRDEDPILRGDAVKAGGRAARRAGPSPLAGAAPPPSLCSTSSGGVSGACSSGRSECSSAREPPAPIASPAAAGSARAGYQAASAEPAPSAATPAEPPAEGAPTARGAPVGAASAPARAAGQAPASPLNAGRCATAAGSCGRDASTRCPPSGPASSSRSALDGWGSPLAASGSAGVPATPPAWWVSHVLSSRSKRMLSSRAQPWTPSLPAASFAADAGWSWTPWVWPQPPPAWWSSRVPSASPTRRSVAVAAAQSTARRVSHARRAAVAAAEERPQVPRPPASWRSDPTRVGAAAATEAAPRDPCGGGEGAPVSSSGGLPSPLALGEAGPEAPAPLREIARPVLRVECPPALADQRASDDELRLTARKTIVAGGFREEDILSVELSANRTVCLVEVSLTA